MSLFFKKKTESSSSERPKARVLSFLNQKGGVGKTTMAFNTAHALVEKGHKVLCLDMDPQANLTLLFGHDLSVTEGYGLHQLLINSIRELRPLHAATLVQDVLIETKGKLDLLPGGGELSGFELSVAGIQAPRQLILKRFLEKNALLDAYDYIVIDGPPTLGLLVVNILCACDGVLVPFRPDEFSRKGLGHFYEAIEGIEDMGVVKAPQVIAHIPNLVDLRRRQESDDLEKIRAEIAKEYGEETVTGPFYNRASLVKSQAEKKSVYDFNSIEFRPLQEQFNDIAGRIQTWRESL